MVIEELLGELQRKLSFVNAEKDRRIKHVWLTESSSMIVMESAPGERNTLKNCSAITGFDVLLIDCIVQQTGLTRLAVISEQR